MAATMLEIKSGSGDNSINCNALMIQITTLTNHDTALQKNTLDTQSLDGGLTTSQFSASTKVCAMTSVIRKINWHCRNRLIIVVRLHSFCACSISSSSSFSSSSLRLKGTRLIRLIFFFCFQNRNITFGFSCLTDISQKRNKITK